MDCIKYNMSKKRMGVDMMDKRGWKQNNNMCQPLVTWDLLNS